MYHLIWQGLVGISRRTTLKNYSRKLSLYRYHLVGCLCTVPNAYMRLLAFNMY